MSREDRLKRKQERRDNFGLLLKRNLATTSKLLIWVFAINAVLWIWCSYVLAFIGKDDIAESLSSNVCTVIIGQLAFYLVSKTVENVFKYNNFGGVTNPELLKAQQQEEEQEAPPADTQGDCEPVQPIQPIEPVGTVPDTPTMHSI